MNLQGKDVRILSGKYAGLVGNVEQVKNGRALVYISGVMNDEPVHKKLWMNLSQLEGGQHG